MIIRKYRNTDYAALSTAWGKHGWIPCPQNMLPDLGLVAYGGRTFLAYLGMYTSRRGGFIDWAVRNPIADRDTAGTAIDTMFKMLVSDAKKRGCQFIYSVTKVESWKKRLVSYGMSAAEEGVTSFVMTLHGEDTAFISD